VASVFSKFGGIRPMASKLGDVPPSTVKSWHVKRQIPAWRHQSILDAAARHGISLTAAELREIPEDEHSSVAHTPEQRAVA
jgi:hypothetical protein